MDARLDGRTFVRSHVDLGVGDEIIEPLDELVGEGWLGFGGIGPAVAPVLSKQQHWAEKLHAYTRPRATGEDVTQGERVGEHSPKRAIPPSNSTARWHRPAGLSPSGRREKRQSRPQLVHRGGAASARHVVLDDERAGESVLPEDTEALGQFGPPFARPDLAPHRAW